MPYLQLNSVRLYYEVEGQGEPVVLLTGGFANLHVWDVVFERLKSQYQVIRWDYRGTGLSSDDPKMDYTLPLLSDDLLALLNHLQLTKAHIAGHSMGGFVAQYFAAHHPERVLSVSLLSSLLKINAAATDFLNSMLASSKRDLPQAQEDIFGIVGSKPSLDTIEHHVKVCLAHDSTPYIAKIQAPVMILGGDQEVVVKDHESALLAAKIADVRRVKELPSGHMLPIEVPELVAQELLKFFREIT